MKKIVSIFAILSSIILCTLSSIASLPDIIALVNDHPITKYDFESRKKMIMILNNIDISNPSQETSFNSGILNLLVEEELLSQYTNKLGNKISKEQVDSTIATIEQKNNMPKGGLRTFLTEKGIDVNDFRKQITSEIIKHNIINSLSNSVSVSQSELDVAIINTSKTEFNIEALIFTSRENSKKDYNLMQGLRKKLSNCNNVDAKLYDNFADSEKFDRKLDTPSNTKSIIHDTKEGKTSSVYEENGKFKLVFMCKKDNTLSVDDLDKLKTFLSNKKMSQKAAKFFKDLKSKADIKVMVH